MSSEVSPVSQTEFQIVSVCLRSGSTIKAHSSGYCHDGARVRLQPMLTRLPLSMLLLLPITAAWAQAEPGSGEAKMAPMRAPPPQPEMRLPRNDSPMLPSERNERFGTRLRPGQTNSDLRERQPIFERQDPRAERYGNVGDRRGGLTGGADRSDSDLNRAIEQVRAEHGGKILSADRMQHRGQEVFRVKVLTPEGRVKTVQLSEPSESTPKNEERR